MDTINLDRTKTALEEAIEEGKVIVIGHNEGKAIVEAIHTAMIAQKSTGALIIVDSMPQPVPFPIKNYYRDIMSEPTVNKQGRKNPQIDKNSQSWRKPWKR